MSRVEDYIPIPPHKKEPTPDQKKMIPHLVSLHADYAKVYACGYSELDTTHTLDKLTQLEKEIRWLGGLSNERPDTI